MYSHFKKQRTGSKSLASILWLILLPFILTAQQNTVSVIVQVYPPFSTQFADYVDDPNKVSVQLLNSSMQPVDVYLRGHFTGDNGIDIYTEEGYKPGSYITLQPNIPFYLTQSDIGDMFTPEHLVFSGITQNDMIQMQGLPEGNYQICITVFDYQTGVQLSPDEPSGCSNSIIIQYVDPPQILSPLCGDSIISSTPQNLLFSWTIPVQTGLNNIRYHFLMVEMHPGDRNPYDAIASAVPPYFYQTDIMNLNQILYGPGDPQLIEGRSYAFVVQAIDESNQVIFKNNGISEACSFTYKKFTPPYIEPDTGFNFTGGMAIDDFVNDFEFLPTTKINGQLRYKLASDAPSGAASGAQSYYQGSAGDENNGTSYQNNVNTGMNSGNLNINNVGLGNFSFQQNSFGNMSVEPPYGSGTINETSVDAGNAEPLRNTMVRLVVRFGIKQADGFFATRTGLNGSGFGGTFNANDYVFFDLNGNELDPQTVLTTVNRVLDVTYTDETGHFSFDFQSDFFTGPVFARSNFGGNLTFTENYYGILSLKVEVVNQKFCSPDVEIFAKPGDLIDIPSQVALIKDYDLHLKVVSAYDYYSGNAEDSTIYIGHDNKPKAIPGGQPIPGATVKVLRDMQKVNNEHPAVLLAEGQQLGTTTVNADGEFKDVFIGKADENGELTIPHLVEHWAITDGEDNSPYFFSVRTRAEQADTTGEQTVNQYENTLYNYLPFFGNINGLRISVESGATTLLDDDAGWSGHAPVIYNHFYVPPQSAKDREVQLEAAKPEIKGRVMVQSNLENIGLSDVNVNLFDQPDIGPDGATIFLNGDDNPDLTGLEHYSWEKKRFTNNAGFFRFKDLAVFKGDYDEARGPYRRFQINHPMYKRITWPPLAEKAFNFKYGELFFKEFQLEPKFLMKAKVVDETGKAVPAYVRMLPNNPYVKTETRYEYDEDGSIYVDGEIVELPVAESNNIIEIQPLSNQYFADTVTIDQLPENPNERVVLTVYKKLHRLHLVVENKETNSGIAGADIIVGDTLAYGKTGNNGSADLVFPSPGQQFLIKVKADGYSPTQVSYNIPVSNTPENKIIFLEPAYSIEGKITDKLSGAPLDSAGIFVRLQNSDGQTVYVESYSGSDGKYTLEGIPMMLTNLDVHVVKDGKNPGYIGAVKTISVEPFAYPKPSYDFQLQPVNNMDISKIWGLPVSIESMTAKPGFGVTVSGFFHDLPSIPGFSAMNDDEKIYFKNLKIEPEPANGKITPLSNNITTQTFYIPVKLDGGFSGNFRIPASFLNLQQLIVTKTGDYGSISAALKLDLASFKFAYDFNGDFYVGDDTLHKEITVFKAVNGSVPQFFINQKYIFDLDNNYKPVPVGNFNVFGFNASSGFKSSFYKEGKIHIGAVLHTGIPMANNSSPLDLKIKAGDIVVTKENIELMHNPDDEISFELEKWNVKSKSGWYFDKTRDAIVIPEATIFTGLGVDAGIRGLNIRPDALREGKINMEGGLSLGGITQLQLADGLEPVFNYDAGVGHYRISLVGNTQGPAAWVDNLPATDDRLEFTSIGMLSDNSSVLSLGKHMLFHNLLDIFVDQIMTGDGFFSLAGMPDLGIPGYVPTRAIMTYTKQGNKLQAKLEPLNGAVDCNANIVYVLDQQPQFQTLVNKKYTSYGDFHIKPPPGESGEELTLRGFLTKTPGECYIDVITPQIIKMGKEKMNLIDGKISVTSNTWGELNFNCNTNSTGLEDDNVVAYTVHGGIEANGDGIKVNKIDTPLGDLEMAYLFAEKALVGNLTIKSDLDLGFAGLKSGMMGMRFDPHGFYLGFSGNILLSSDIYGGGFILGDYGGDLSEVTTPMLKDFETAKPDFSSLHGFYVIAQRTLVDKSFPLLVIDVSAKAGIGTFIHLDYSDGLFQIGGYGFGKAKGGVNITGCGFVGVKQSAYADIKGTYHNGDLSLSVCQSMETCVGACGLDGCITILDRIKVSTSGNDFILKLGGSCSDYGD